MMTPSREVEGRGRPGPERAQEATRRDPASARSPLFIEFDLPDPAALDAEWNYTDRAQQLYRTGHRLIARGFSEEAAGIFKRATRYDRAHYFAYVGQTEALILLGRTEEAANVANATLERYGRNCLIGAARGHIFLHQQEIETANQCAEIAIAGAPEGGYVWLIAGEVRLAMPGALHGAMSCFDRARYRPEGWPNMDVRIGLALLEWGHTREAVRALTQVLKRNPKHPLAWILLGDAHRILGNKKESRECHRRAAELVPELESLRRAPGWRQRLAAAWGKLRSS